MEEYQTVKLWDVVIMPFIFVLYLFYIVLSIFLPNKYVIKIINLEFIENKTNLYFNNPFYLKLVALLITICLFIYFYLIVK